MKICFICPEYPPFPHGGMGTFVQVMGRALTAAGHEVRAIGLYPATNSYPAYEEDHGVQVWRLRSPAVPYGWVVGRFRLYWQVRRWVRQRHVEVVDAHDPEGWFAGWPRMQVPLMIRAGGSFSYFAHDLGQPVSPTMFRFERNAYLRSDAWIAKSRYIGDVTKRLFQLRSGPDAILYNPVNVPDSVTPFEQRRASEVVFTGTLTPKKGIVSLIDAWAAVREKCPQAELQIYGKEGRAADGQPMQQYLRQRLSESARSSVHFHGHVTRDELYQVLSRARVAVFPSFSEGFAWAPLEAMANGCPTIYTCLGSGAELICDGRDGLLVDPNRPEQITRAIVQVLSNEQSARQLSESGRGRIMNAFTLDKLLPLNEAFYHNLIRRFHHSTIGVRELMGNR
jgi:glycosyltransferase involved in cell wall biosynthesis